ncbi:MAG: hypothetical protein M3490_12000 [Chloroflexota bacterium]|nr:hypothetical protein [Chloroflexota bacterium]
MVEPPQPSRITRRQLLTASTVALSVAPFIVPNRVFAQTPVASPEASPIATRPQLYVPATDVQFDEAFDIGAPVSNLCRRSRFRPPMWMQWGRNGPPKERI